MPKWGDDAWTAPEPGGTLDKVTIVGGGAADDRRLSDPAYEEMPAGGWFVVGDQLGSATGKVPPGHDPANPGSAPPPPPPPPP